MMNRIARRQARRRGFTLIELVVVMMIIAILAGAIAVNIRNRVDLAKRARALSDVKTLELAIDLYAIDNGDPPTTQQGIDALQHRPSTAPVPRNWNGPYLKKNVRKDPWDNDYVYRSPGQLNPDGYDIICYGKDGQPGGADLDADITNASEE